MKPKRDHLNLLTRSTMYAKPRMNLMDSMDSEFSFSNFHSCNEYGSIRLYEFTFFEVGRLMRHFSKKYSI